METQATNNRFWSKVYQRPGGCWIYDGKADKSGHCSFCRTKTKRVYAHRFAYEYINGRIPQRTTIDHLCVNYTCVNPDHLEAIPNQYTGIYRFGFYYCADDAMLQSISRDFWAKVKILEDGCWLYPGRTTHARRFAYYERKRPLPTVFTIQPTCGNIRCVRPDHLEYL